MRTYEAESAAFLLSYLRDCSGPRTTYYGTCDASRIGTDRDVTSDYPQWYRDATSGRAGDSYGKLDGDNIRAALACVAEGRDPNTKQQEARWIMEALARARTHGDATLGLQPAPRGGGERGVTQAYHSGESVGRVPLRIPIATLARLRDCARRDGVSVNAYITSVLGIWLEGPAGQ